MVILRLLKLQGDGIIREVKASAEHPLSIGGDTRAVETLMRLQAMHINEFQHFILIDIQRIKDEGDDKPKWAGIEIKSLVELLP